MIKTTPVFDIIKRCDNCNRRMQLLIKYEFTDKETKLPYVKLHLCEDCSNAMANLHYTTVTLEKPHKYDLDEITEIKEGEE